MSRQSCPTWGEFMSRPSILTSRQKISGYKVSMSRHSALCHDNGVRHCVANKARCARDRGARQRSSVAHDIEALSPGAHDRHECATGMHARQRRERDKGIISQQTCTEAKKKKKAPRDLGRHTLTFNRREKVRVWNPFFFLTTERVL